MIVTSSHSRKRMPCRQYAPSSPSLPVSFSGFCTASTGLSIRAICQSVAWPSSRSSSIASSSNGAPTSPRRPPANGRSAWSSTPSPTPASTGGPSSIGRARSIRTTGHKNHLRQQGVTQGLIGILCVQETCPTFRLAAGQGRPCFQPTQTPQRVLYFYFLDRDLGLLHVRLQTWVPFTCQVYVNGHDYVAQQLARQRLGFVQRDNAFVQLDEPTKAQQYADRFARLKWPALLERYARLVNPLLHDVLKGRTHYWVVDQAEYATDILFTSKQALAGLFGRLLEYAWLTFTPKNVLAFLGRKLHAHFTGEVLTQCRTEREPGRRIKHRMKGNWLKMYDKFGLLLRVETVINQPGEFKVYRECPHRDGTTSTGWYALTKGVG